MNAVVQEAVPENSPLTTSEIMERMFEIRSERKTLSERDSELVQEWEKLEQILLGRFDEQGSVRVTSRQGTASISEQTLAIVEDWDAVDNYIIQNRATHLLQRRVAVGAYREMLAAGQSVPGTRPITKRSINLRVS